MEIPPEKLETIKRNFKRFCEACKITDAFVVFHYSDEYHGIMLYLEKAGDPCKIIVKLYAANNSILKGAVGDDLKSNSINLN